jgi:hypothetical protein
MVECLPEVEVVIVVVAGAEDAPIAPVIVAGLPKNVADVSSPRADANSAKRFLGKSAQKQLL